MHCSCEEHKFCTSNSIHDSINIHRKHVQYTYTHKHTSFIHQLEVIKNWKGITKSVWNAGYGVASSSQHSSCNHNIIITSINLEIKRRNEEKQIESLKTHSSTFHPSHTITNIFQHTNLSSLPTQFITLPTPSHEWLPFFLQFDHQQTFPPQSSLTIITPIITPYPRKSFLKTLLNLTKALSKKVFQVHHMNLGKMELIPVPLTNSSEHKGRE